jgi:hypothetical protein
MSLKTKGYTTTVVLAVVVIGSLMAGSAASLHRTRATVRTSSIKRPGQIHGTVYTELDANSGRRTFLPDISIFLKDTETGTQTDPVVSGDNGRYSVSAPKPGSYQLCWMGQGWLAGCDPKIITIANGQTRFPGMTRILPDLGNGLGGQSRGIITGHVTLADGSACQFSDALFGINQRATVTVFGTDGRPLGQSVHVNSSRDYVLSGLPQTKLRVQASCGGTSTELWLIPATAPPADGSSDLIIPNHRPKILNMSAEQAGTIVTAIPSESNVTLSLEAKDDDGDAVQVSWAAPAGVGRISSLNGNSAIWTAPRGGVQTLYALVSDGKGGYTAGAITLAVGAAGAAQNATSTEPNWEALDSSSDIAQASSMFGQALAAAPKAAIPTPTPDYLTFKGIGSMQDATNYYLMVDPEGRRTFLNPSQPDITQTHTLSDWWQVAGFNADGSGGVRAAYLNNNDLGFGRDMHCIEGIDDFGGVTVSCYVTNYGKPDQNIKNADLAFKAWNADGTPNDAIRAQSAATVCMEYSPIDQDPSGVPVVKFFVYAAPGDGSSHLLLSANLDGRPMADKFVPNLCLNCHGGEPANAPDQGASFREFDLASFRYSKLRGASRASQEFNFEDMNFMVQDSNAAQPIQDLISGWYANSNTQDTTFVPPGWSAHPDLYQKVVAKSCRTCHIAQLSVTDDSISWNTYDQFSLKHDRIQEYVCSPQKEMPHALITYKNFWLSKNPHRPGTLAAFKSLPEWAAFGNCK